MVSSSHGNSNSAKGAGFPKKARSPSPSKKDRELSRYEFDSKTVPKGHRTEKKKIFVKKHGSESSPPPPESEAAAAAEERPVEQSKHLKRLRTGRTGKIPRNKPELETDVNVVEEKAAKVEDSKKSVRFDEEEKVKPEEKVVQEQEEQHEENVVLKVAEEIKPPEPEKDEKDDEQDSRTEAMHAAEPENPTAQKEAPITQAEKEAPENLKLDRDVSKEAFGNTDVSKEAPKAVSHEVNTGEQQQQQQPEEEPKLPEPDTSLSLGLSGPHRVRRVRSVQSISQAETFSHGVTTSLSLSCSHQFTHNPSCSLMTQTSFDNQEFSSASQPVLNPETASVSAGGRFGDSGRSNREFSSKVRGASEGPQYSHPKGALHKKQKIVGLSRSSPRVTVREIVSDPVPEVARRMRELPFEGIQELKIAVRELLEREERRDDFLHLQRVVQSRGDVSEEALQGAHRTQLEILVAMKTGIRGFLSQEQQHSKALIEVFLQLRCRNVQCLNQLPVDNCECIVCTRKSGFCNACMCVVCSSFDFEHNTCSWVGCDYCIHWCHTDCGLRKAHVKPGQAIRGAPGASEMQFHCIACGKTSELFGFVKDVFSSCAESWNRGTLSKELDCVRRMFQGSEDLRGKQLCWKAGQLIGKLENNEGAAAEACKSMLRFFEDGTILPSEEENLHVGAATTTRSDGPTASVIERASMALQTYDRVLEEKRTDAAEMQYERARKKAEIEELESIVRIKQAEAKMFQARADEASREAEGLRRIVVAKVLKVEEEYAAKKSKLQLLEAEEKRKRKFENLKLLESGSYNFDIVRKLMGDLQGLLTNMEAAKRLKSEDISSVDKYLQRYLQPR